MPVLNQVFRHNLISRKILGKNPGGRTIQSTTNSPCWNSESEIELADDR